nr:endoplasmin homolog [Ipomoea batatas]
MESGFILNDPKDFASRIYGSVKSSLKINPDAAVEEEEEAEETEAETSAKETDSSPQTNDVKKKKAVRCHVTHFGLLVNVGSTMITAVTTKLTIPAKVKGL